LECEGDVTWSQVNDYIVGANGTSGNPVDIAHDVVKGLEPTDEIVGVGYPDREDAASVAIVREGSTIAIASFERASDGGWLLGGGQGCDASGIRF
jgi:hypothetical protein